MAVSVASWPFVGRRGELERIDDALADERSRAVVIAGRSGVGKSRLAEEGLAAARARSMPVAHATATSVAATVPLSALSPILPPRVDLGDPYALFTAVRDQLFAGSRGERVVLAVDDVDLLDTTSVALLGFLLAEEALFVIATIRTGAPVPEPLDALWRGGRAIRIELGTFERPALDTLLHLALRGPVTALTAQALWDASQGNIFYLRELVTVARDEGALRAEDGVWTLSARFAPGAGVAALVERRVRDLPAHDRAALDALAACGPLGIDDLEAHAPAAALDRLEKLELIAVHTDGRRQRIALGHPLHARVLRGALPKLAARRILLAQIERLRGYGARRRGDDLLLAGWLLDATGTADSRLLAQAAALARYAHDTERARHLAEAALRDGPDAQASVVLGEVLADEGDPAGAERVFAAAFAAAGPSDVDLVAVSRAVNLFFGLDRVAEARACLREAIERGGARPSRVPVAMDGLILSFAGRSLDALALIGDAEPPAEAGGDGARLHVLWLMARSHALVEIGDPVAAEPLCRRALHAHLALDNRTGLPHPATHLVTLADALAVQGRLVDAVAACEYGHQLATASHAGTLGYWFPLTRGFLELSRGRPIEAATQFRVALAEARRSVAPAAPGEPGTGAPLPEGVDTQAALAGIVLSGALVGEVDPAASAAVTRACEAADAAGEDGTATPEYAIMQRALAWSEANAGDVAGARDRLHRMAGICRSLGRRGHELQVLSDLVRLGGTGEVLDRVVELTADSPLPLARARAMHARATRARSPGDLVEAADAFAALGADLIAAEVYAAAARLWHADGDGRAAARATARSNEIAAACQGARTPGLLAPEAVGPLSPREREIALLAARGVPSREIAEKLFLSVRTVNNHLQSVYSKLGVSARAELADALRTTATPTKGRDT